jgi:hypothetical protein
MKQWPKVDSKVIYKGTPKWFFFPNMLKDADRLLGIGKEYTIAKIELASSWCAVVLKELPDEKFSLSWFDYEKELTTEEVRNIEKEAWETVKYEFKTLEELKNKKYET